MSDKRSDTPKQSSRASGRKTSQASQPAAKDATPAIRNFLIGLLVCCIVIGCATFLIINFQHAKEAFLLVSRKVSDIVPKESRPEKKSPTIEEVAPSRDELFGDEETKVEKQEIEEQATEPRPKPRRQRMRIE